MSSRRMVEAGHRALAAGRSLELSLDFVHERYERQGQAIAERIGTRSRAIRTPEGGTRFLAQRSPVDYIVSVRVAAGPPIYVAFDAKTTQSHSSWSLHKRDLHQRDMLARLAGIGSPAFFLIECRPRRLAYLLPIKPLIGVLDPAPRLSFDESRHLAIELDGFGLIDWLPKLRELWGIE